MYDRKTIRRRRAVLALLVVSSVVLLTASFGGNGGVGSVQRGVFEIVSPIQDVASRSLKPFRDLFGWFGDTWHAKGDNKTLVKTRDQLREQNGSLQAEVRKLKEQYGINRVIATANIGNLGPVEARVVVASPTLLFQKVTINKGAGDGVRSGQPVVTAGGLVGKVDVVVGGSATVTLITDPRFGAGVRLAQSGITGTMTASGGDPEDLIVATTKQNAPVSVGSTVVTRGTSTDVRLPSLFPPDIPIGKVTTVDDAGTDTQRVHVKPFVDVRNLDHVMVLTRDAATVP
ncbi:rod shape-determining protein MreC [Paraconexibacter antarcticus]|uniref:Cell shape-determining protein MreC n=1 Tax=Paraconexibacter antarcticus TaxID=2949664 RepID=A0ABY5DKU7_9ACTN|nr:rod shape-determining protein MreC [Paraconexibacter antarcticus]UTI62373.1 rod shape-determining protein MreC [Paraconexibacter antarcticus]